MDLHGYALADIDRLARIACRNLPSADPRDAYETAWSAIAERLCAPEPVHDGYLVRWGRIAIQDAWRDDDRQYGRHRDQRRIGHGEHPWPRFGMYWDQRTVTPSPEHAIVERETVAAILGTLTPTEREAVLALAVTGDYQQAADLLGLQYSTLVQRLRAARVRFRRHWHEGETPSKAWARDQRRSSDGSGQHSAANISRFRTYRRYRRQIA